MTLDSLGLDDVCAVKIDVEGHELQVLNGAAELLERQHPTLYVECLSADEFDAVGEFLSGFDYVYEASFNATPTHRFAVQDPQAVAGGRLALGALMRQYYTALDRERTATTSLRAANVKYRSATERVDLLKRQVEDLLAQRAHSVPSAEGPGSPDIVSEHAALQQQFHDLTEALELERARSETLSKAHSDLQAELRSARADLIRRARAQQEAATVAAAQAEDLLSARTALDSHRADLEELRGQLETSQKDLAAAQSDVAASRVAETTTRRELEAGLAQRQDLERRLHTAQDRLAELTQDLARQVAADRERQDLVRYLSGRVDTAEAMNVDLLHLRETASTTAAENARRLVRTREDFALLRAWIGEAQRRELDDADARAREQSDHAEEMAAAQEEHAAVLEQTQASLATTQRHNRQIRRRAEQAEARVAELEALLAACQANSHELGDRLDAAERGAADLANKLALLRESATYQAGQALRDARSLSGLARLPGRLSQLAREAKPTKEIEQ